MPYRGRYSISGAETARCSAGGRMELAVGDRAVLDTGSAGDSFRNGLHADNTVRWFEGLKGKNDMIKKILVLCSAVAVYTVLAAAPCGPRPPYRPGPWRPAPAHHHGHHHGSAFWPGFAGGVVGGIIGTTISRPAPVVVTTPTVVTTPVVTTPVVTQTVVEQPVTTVQNVWIEGRYVDQVQANGTVVRVWQPGHYEQRTIVQ